MIDSELDPDYSSRPDERDEETYTQEGPGLFDAADDTPTPSEPALASDKADEAPLALYRRYRPDTFAQVIGQDHVTVPLMRAIENNKVHHAYLFSGPRGCGKTTSARILARCLNCENGPTPTPCGQCQSCRDLATGGPGSIDVIEVDAASHGGIDDARDLRERAFFAPVASRYKIYIIDEAHMVTPQGFNALLKVVEEPPEHVKFIFATTEPDKVISTIRSRTHHYPFRLVPPKVLTAYLADICTQEQVNVDQGVLALVVRAGGGSVRDSLSVLDQLLGAANSDGERLSVSYHQAAALLGYTPDALLDEIIDAFAAGDGKGVFSTIDKVIEIGQDPRRFGEDMLQRVRDLVIVAQVPDAIESGIIDVSVDQAERLKSQAAALGSGELTRAGEVIASGLAQMRGTTTPRLFLELICSRVLLPVADLDGRGLHARLDRLERRLDMPATLEASGNGAGNYPVANQTSIETRSQVAVEPSAPNPLTRSSGPGSAGETGSAVQPPSAQRPATVQRPANRQRPVTPQQSANPQPSPSAQRPAPQRQRPAGQEPASGSAQQRVPLQRHREVVQPQAQAPAVQQPQAAGSKSDLDIADVRRVWPQVLEALKHRRRFTHALISQSAQPASLANGTLSLAFTNPGTVNQFRAPGNIEMLKRSLVDVLGAELNIQAVVERSSALGSNSSSTAAGPSQPADVPLQEGASPDDEVVDDLDANAEKLIATRLGGRLIQDDGEPR